MKNDKLVTIKMNIVLPNLITVGCEDFACCEVHRTFPLLKKKFVWRHKSLASSYIPKVMKVSNYHLACAPCK